mgnify:CR=1 FL=1
MMSTRSRLRATWRPVALAASLALPWAVQAQTTASLVQLI